MLSMAKRKPKEDQGGKPRSGKNLNVWIAPEIRDALDSLVEESRRSLTAEVELALEEWLRQQGHWPPPSKEEES